MTAKQLLDIRQALDRATTALGVAGEAATLGKSKDAERALKEAAEELARCRAVAKDLRPVLDIDFPGSDARLIHVRMTLDKRC